MDLPFNILTILREARIKRYKEEAERQAEIQRKQEKEAIKNKIMKK